MDLQVRVKRQSPMGWLFGGSAADFLAEVLLAVLLHTRSDPA